MGKCCEKNWLHTTIKPLNFLFLYEQQPFCLAFGSITMKMTDPKGRQISRNDPNQYSGA